MDLLDGDVGLGLDGKKTRLFGFGKIYVTRGLAEPPHHLGGLLVTTYLSSAICKRAKETKSEAIKLHANQFISLAAR